MWLFKKGYKYVELDSDLEKWNWIPTGKPLYFVNVITFNVDKTKYR